MHAQSDVKIDGLLSFFVLAEHLALYVRPLHCQVLQEGNKSPCLFQQSVQKKLLQGHNGVFPQAGKCGILYNSIFTSPLLDQLFCYAFKKIHIYTVHFLKIGFYEFKDTVRRYLLNTAYSELPVLDTIRLKMYGK